MFQDQQNIAQKHLIEAQNSNELTWIISVISAIHCCLARSSFAKASTGSLGNGCGIDTFKAVAINNKTCIKSTYVIPYMEDDETKTTKYKLNTKQSVN